MFVTSPYPLFRLLHVLNNKKVVFGFGQIGRQPWMANIRNIAYHQLVAWIFPRFTPDILFPLCFFPFVLIFLLFSFFVFLFSFSAVHILFFFLSLFFSSFAFPFDVAGSASPTTTPMKDTSCVVTWTLPFASVSASTSFFGENSAGRRPLQPLVRSGRQRAQ